ncbi:MAG: sulfite exporter TauE/SafE family protein [Candidatus Dadabacteria bacterium]
MYEIIGYCCAALIGLSLGLIGGGGSILTVPVLVYFFHISPLLATSYSLFIVGSTSLIGAVNNFTKKLVDLNTGLLFGVTSVVTVFITRKFIIPSIPHHIATIKGFEITFSFLTMVLFALLMMVASISMVTKGVVEPKKEVHKKGSLIFYGIAIGLVTGFLGAGGGFLLIPVLVVVLGLHMKMAVGTSLFIIAINSLIGFIGDLGHYSINWDLLLMVTLIAVAGVFVGGIISKQVKGLYLRKGFGWFVMSVGVYILIKEIFFP